MGGLSDNPDYTSKSSEKHLFAPAIVFASLVTPLENYEHKKVYVKSGD